MKPFDVADAVVVVYFAVLGLLALPLVVYLWVAMLQALLNVPHC